MNTKKRLVVSGLVVVLWSASAAAQERASCAESYEKAQTERVVGKYLSAIEYARACATLECNATISRECMNLHEQLQNEVPTFVFSARKGGGGELTNVRVTLDGVVVKESLDGRPVRMDPGAHDFVFETEGFPPVEAQHTARAGDHHRLVEVVFGEEPAQTVDAPVTSDTMPPSSAEPRGIPAASYVLAGVGVVALGAFTYLRATGIQDYNELNSSCSPQCEPDDVDPIRNKFTFSWVALGVGVASFGAATAVYVLSRDESGAPSAEVSLTPGPGTARAAFSARF